MIDLSRLKGVRVDPAARTVRVEAGCTQGDVDHATHAFGLAVPAGIVSTTGIAGLTLGGGTGYLTRAMVSRSTICSRPTSCSRTGSWWRASARMTICSGRCAAAAAISAW